MKRKKPGFTLLEMIIVISLTTVVLGIVSSMFITGERVFFDSDVNSTLQMEARDIQEELTSVGMQGVGIDDIKIGDFNHDDDSLYVDKNYSELKRIINEANSSDIDEDPSIIYKIVGYDKNSEYPRSVPEPYDIKFDNNTISINSKMLSQHVKSFDVIPQDDTAILKNSASIEFKIVLETQRGLSNTINYPINVKVTFRNKNR